MQKKYTAKHTSLLNKTIKENFPLIYPIDESMKTSYQGISRLVMLDRYSNKDLTLKTLQVGDLVIAKIKFDPKFPTLGTGFIKSIGSKSVEVEIEMEYIAQIDPNLKPNNGIIKLLKGSISKPLEIYYEQIAKRVGNHLAEDENQKYAKIFSDEIAQGNIVPAGRVLYGSGSGTQVTYFNCYVMPMIHDSREGIANHRKEVMEIMSRGGGVGTNGSTLRPKNSVAISVGGTSSGAVSWLNDLASLTDLVQQGGSRRGAQMIMLHDWHPDILEFIISKMQKPEVLKWISQNFQDKDIRQLARDKLKLKPLSPLLKKMAEDVIKNSDDINLIKEAKLILQEGGTYEVVFPEFLSGANISVCITNDFMKAIKNNAKYKLKFPDVGNLNKEQKAFYESNWHKMGDVREWEKLGYPTKVYKQVHAKELWDLINFCATYSAEPGVFFIDRANEMTNALAYDQKVVCTNPCGEQPLAPYSVCNLAAINLANMVDHKTGDILWEKLENTIKASIRMQDNIIDKTPYFLKANEIQATGERRIGMGVMGLHDFLIWNRKRYGSPSANALINKLFEKIASIAYLTSADLAEEKGSFGFLKDRKRLFETGFIKKLPKHVKKAIREKGLRNSHLLTIAPTGSTGTMMGVSTGLEPYFAFKYFRSGRLGKFIEVDQQIVTEWKKNNNFPEGKKLPNIFTSSMDLTPEEHANTQIIIQRWIDSSISKTVNAPKGYTVKQVEKIYTKLYNNGAKGGTVYVDGSRDAQVLSISNSDASLEIEFPTIQDESSKEKVEAIKEKHANVPGNKLDKNIGTNVGDVCPICKEGTIEDLGGCNSCTNCGAQLKCGI